MTFAMRNSLFLIQLFWGQKIHEKINLGTQYLFFAPRIRGSRCLHSAAWFARVAAAVFAVPELREVILEQKGDLSAQRHGPGQVGQDALQIRFVFLIAHIMSNEKIGLRLALLHYSFSQVCRHRR
jgi:hypothetical protein